MKKIKVWKLIMKIAKWCKTWCNLCLEWQKKDIEFFNDEEISKLYQVLDNIEHVIDLASVKVFTFYGSTVMKHPKILELFQKVETLIPWVTFCIDIGDVVPYDQQYLDFLLELKQKYPVIYVFVRNVDDMKLLKYGKDWSNFFQFLVAHPDFLDREPSIRYGTGDYLSLKIIQTILSHQGNRLRPTYAKHPYAVHSEKKFYSERLGTPLCKYLTYATNTWDSLIFWHDENELNIMIDGSLTIHTNICFLSKYRYIANVLDEEEKIVQDMNQFYQNLEQVNSGTVSLEEACYRCIYWIHSTWNE